MVSPRKTGWKSVPWGILVLTCRMERCLGGCKCDPDTDPEPDPDAERLNKLLVEIALIEMTNFNRVAPGIALGV